MNQAQEETYTDGIRQGKYDAVCALNDLVAEYRHRGCIAVLPPGLIGDWLERLAINSPPPTAGGILTGQEDTL